MSGKSEEQEKPSHREPAPEVAARDDVRVVASPTRCPYCHEGVRADSKDQVACKGCLARHHAGCWREARACGTCGGKNFFSNARERRLALALAIVLVLVLVIGAGIVVGVKFASAGSRYHADITCFGWVLDDRAKNEPPGTSPEAKKSRRAWRHKVLTEDSRTFSEAALAWAEEAADAIEQGRKPPNPPSWGDLRRGDDWTPERPHVPPPEKR